jgi:uncharacterized protein (DUF1697 family)
MLGSQSPRMPPNQTTFVALVRGVNVGKNILKMDRLRKLCEDIGMRNVRTYVQSGNVVFEAAGTPEKWSNALEKKLLGECRLNVSVAVRTSRELSAIVDGNPFLKEKGIDAARLAVTFLEEPIALTAKAALNALEIGNERFHCRHTEIYLHCPNGFAEAKLYLLDKVLAQRTTVRNWNTVTKLCEMCRASE